MSGWWGTASAKQEFMRRLSVRAGLLGGGQPFSFDSRQPPAAPIDFWRNLYQLEAVVEFYTNLYDPATNQIVRSIWAKGAKLLDPTDSRYTVADFSEPRGSEAKLVGANVVQLDGQPDLRDIIVNPPDADNPPLPGAPAANPGYPAQKTYLYDCLWLGSDIVNGAQGRASRLYRIMAVDNVKKTVTIDTDDPTPNLAGSTSNWKINRRPILVIIDPFGPRRSTGTANAPAEATVDLHGNNATVIGPDPNNANLTVLHLDLAQRLERINVGFDTIYLPSDTTQGDQKPWGTYRIMAVDPGPGNHNVTVAGKPVLANGSSNWQIPAGVSGSMPDLTFNMAPPAAPAPPPPPPQAAVDRAARGYDQYDGMLFVVYGGRIADWFRWTSLTSRDQGTWTPPGQDWRETLSSVMGNAPYFFSSYRSGEPFKGYSFAVVDIRPRHDLLHNPARDSIHDAVFYFGTAPAPNPPPPDPNALGPASLDANGKTQVRLHRGNFDGHNSGSAGCLVSPHYVLMRTRLVRLYLQEFRDFYGPGAVDTELNKIAFNAPPNAIDIDLRTQQNVMNANQLSAAVYGDGPNNMPVLLTSENWNDKVAGKLWVIRPDEVAI